MRRTITNEQLSTIDGVLATLRDAVHELGENQTQLMKDPPAPDLGEIHTQAYAYAAVNQFAAWLTTNPKALAIGAKENAAPVAALVRIFADHMEWDTDHEDFSDAVHHFPSGPGWPEPDTDGVKFELSDQGIRMLMFLEGVELQPYKDQAGIWTIGVGHVINDDEEHLYQGITEDKAFELLLEDVKWAAETVWHGLEDELRTRWLKVDPRNNIDALIIFCFNVGAQAFRTSTLLRRVNARRFGDVPYELSRWKYVTDPTTGEKVVSQGLVNRRELTARLWTEGVYQLR